MTQIPPSPVPPVNSDPLFDDNRLPVWPKAVGIVSIVVGSIGVLCNGCGAVIVGVSPMLMKMAEAQNGPAPAQVLPGLPQLVASVAAFLWSVLLIVAGSLTVGRRPSGRPLHLVYAVGGIVLSAIGLYLTMRHNQAVVAWAQQNPDNKWAAQFNSPGQQVGQTIGLAIGAVMGFGYPLFLLVWFGLVKTNSDEIARGTEGRAA